MNYFRFILFLCLTLFSLLPRTAEAHSPYFVNYSDWVVSEGQEYQLQGWYGDGIFFSDPVRVVLRNRNGGVSAVTARGTQASGYCYSIDFCWGFTFDSSGLFPTLWRLIPSEMERTPPKQEGKDFGYPETSKDAIKGFSISYNYFMLPVAWITLLPRLTHGFVLTLPVFIAFLAFWYGAKFVKKRNPTSGSAKALKNFTWAVLVLLTGSTALVSVIISLLYGWGLLVALPFLAWMWIGKMWKMNTKIFT